MRGMPKLHEFAPSLPADVSRCHDEQCKENKSCARFLQRERGGVRIRHASSLREKNGCFKKIQTQ